MATLYLTLSELKTTLSVTGTYADADVDTAVNAACRAIDQMCNRRFYVDEDTAQVRYYTPERCDSLSIDDLVTLTSLAVDSDGDGTFDQTWTLNSDFNLEPLNAVADSQAPEPYTSLSVRPLGRYTLPQGWPRSVQVTGKFGWPQIPDQIAQASTLLATRLLTLSRSAPLGIMSFDGGAVRIARADPSVMLLIGPFIRHRIAVA